MDQMYYWLVIVAGAFALLYGIWATKSVLAASAGTQRMQEIAAAVQEGAKAYLNKQYTLAAMASAGARPWRAASAVRTLARTDTFMPI